MANFFSNTSDLQNILDVLQTKALPTIHTSVCEAFPSAVDQVIQPPEGFYYSQVNVAGDSNLIADNIKSGVTIFGVEGSLVNSGGSFEMTPKFTYTVNSISGAQYGFKQLTDGYWESQNKGIDSSYAICRVNFTVNQQCKIVFDVINYAESSWDYAIFGKLDTALGLNNQDDAASKVQQNFKGLSFEFIQNVIYENVSVGNHYIDIKFVKDSSASSSNDSVRFKIQDNSSLSPEVLESLIEADEDLKAENIRTGVNILGIEGTYGSADPDIDALFNRNISGSYTNNTLTTIPSGAFVCSPFSSIKFNKATIVNDMAFASCGSLKYASFPICKSVGEQGFYACFNLNSVYFPECSYVGYMAFGDCNLKTASFPALRQVDTYGFYYNTTLSSVSMYQLYSIGQYAFAYCSSLAKASFHWCKSIASSAFMRCYKLSELRLMSSAVCSLLNSNAFSSTPFAGYSASFSGTPRIYVPSSLVASYKAATNWSYFSNYISGV